MRGRHLDPGEPLGRGCAKKAVAGEPEDQALGRSRGGFTTIERSARDPLPQGRPAAAGRGLHLLTDADGLPLAIHLTPGQRHESRGFEPLMAAVRLPRRRGRPRTRPRRLLGDRACSTPAIREHCRKRATRPLTFDPAAYRKRNAAERCVGWLEECRGIGTRFGKLAVNFLAMVKLACVGSVALSGSLGAGRSGAPLPPPLRAFS